MEGTMERPVIHVEGENDQHALVHLLILNGVNYDSKPWPTEFPAFKPVEGVERLVSGMELAVRFSGGLPIGFVLDADAPLQDRWNGVCAKLRTAGVEMPGIPPEGGFLGYSALYSARVGVWLMPDNQQDGKLETFLRTLVAERDRLHEHAEEATCRAKQIGAQFAEADRDKAIIQAWLAWQKEPGEPYGRAIRKHYFRHDSPAANAFVAWFKTLYGISGSA